MRILYHHRTRATDAQGIHILEMVRAFRAVGHEVEIVALVETEARHQAPDDDAKESVWQRLAGKVPFAYELLQLLYNPVGFWALRGRIRRKRPDFIYERYSLMNFAGVLAASVYGLPLILEVNSPLAHEMRAEGRLRLFRLALWLERLICNRAARVIVVTGALKRIMLAQGVSVEKLIVMPNGVNGALFQVSAADGALRESLGLSGKTVFGFVGWFRPWHGLELLVRAFGEAGLAEMNAALLLVGDGPAMRGLRELVQEYRLEKSVVFTGPLRHEDVPRHIALFDVAVQPSANEYCCPMKIIEYLALGKPVLAPVQENIQELVEDGREALLFQPGDERSMASAMMRIAGDDALLAQLSEAAARSIEERGLLWTRNAERVVELVPAGQK